jgi:RNA polymerase primary sigma factor
MSLQCVSTNSLTKSQREDIVGKIRDRVSRIFVHEDFDNPSKARSILADMPDAGRHRESSRQIKAQYDSSAVAGHSRVCYESALLTREQEYHLFRKYNFYKYRAKIKLEKRQIADALRELKLADAVRRTLASANVRLAIPIVKKYSKNRHFDDLISEGYYMILKAVDYFDFNRGFKFSTYGTWVVIRNMQRAVKQLHQHDAKNQTGFDKCDFHAESGSTEPDDNFNQIQNKELIDTLLEYCTLREREVLQQRFFQDKTLKDIAQQMGLSRERVRQIQDAALKSIYSQAKQRGITVDEIW